MKAYDVITAAPVGAVVLPSELPGDEEEVRSAVLWAYNEGLIEAVFRPIAGGEWVDSLVPKFIGVLPDKIGIGFRRK